jgi:hypothetical protein
MTLARPFRAVALVVIAACASQSGGAELAPARGDARTITAAELATATQLNLFDYVQATRPLWLRQQAAGLPIVVFVDDARLGGPSTLRSLTLATVSSVRYYDASAAQQKFTGRDLGPVIHVISIH